MCMHLNVGQNIVLIVCSFKESNMVEETELREQDTHVYKT